VICLLFGTDGIRGKIITNPEKDSSTIDDLQKRRCISPRFMRLVGEALTRIIKIDDTVIVGWDNRPDNPKLVDALTQGLHLGNCKVILETVLLRACTMHFLKLNLRWDA